jgi:hypothetical protein
VCTQYQVIRGMEGYNIAARLRELKQQQVIKGQAR